jgi:hypothetical protein
MGILGTVLVASALAAGGGAHTPTPSLAATASAAHPIVFGTEASNKRLAEVQAQRALDGTRVPPSARPVTEAPAPRLEEALSTSGEPNLIQRWKWFVAPGTTKETFAWFRAHPPAGGRIGAYSSRGDGAESVESIRFEITEHSRRVYGPTVIPIVARLPGHRVGIRLEVQQIWKTPHPGAAKVPAAARFLFVSRRGGGKATQRQLVRSTRRVRKVARAIDRLPAQQPQVYYGCLEYPGEEPLVARMLFRAHKGGPLLAEAVVHVPGGVCDPMTLQVAGDDRTFGLLEGERVLALLRRR